MPYTDSEKVVTQFEAEGLAGQNLNDVLQYMMCKFETLMDENCTHLLEREWKV